MLEASILRSARVMACGCFPVSAFYPPDLYICHLAISSSLPRRIPARSRERALVSSSTGNGQARILIRWRSVSVGLKRSALGLATGNSG